MKTLVNGLAGIVHKAPWAVVIITLIVSFVLGGLGGQFQPAEDQNESFAPEAAELTAATTIAERFGAVQRLQVMTSSTTGDVITLEGLEAATALEESIRASDAASLLVDAPNSPAILSYMAPVQFAVQAGAPVPTSDAEVKALYAAGLEQVPPEFQQFLVALLSDDADASTATAELGLTSITYESSDDFDELAANALAIGEAVLAAPTPDTITNEPFSVELIFASGDDFQEEILRLLLAAALIIILVLAIVFLVKPRNVTDRALFVVGALLMAAGIGVAIAPNLALVFPDIFPESWADISVGTVAITTLLLYTAAFLLWTFGSPRRLRRVASDTLLTFLTIGLAIQWTNGYGFLRFEDQSQLVQILPILLIGLGVDYAIHMNTRYRQEASSNNKTVDVAIGTAIRTVGIALVLATVTTAVGFLTNVTNDIPALAEFGELAAFGIVASFLLMLTFVPSVRLLLDRRGERKGTFEPEALEGGDSRALPRFIGRFSWLAKHAAVATVIVALLVTGLSAYSMTNLSTKFSFLDFVPTTSPLRDTAVTLEERFDFPETTSVLVEGDVAAGASWNGMLASYLNAADVENVNTIITPLGAEFPLGNSLMGVMFQFLNPGGDQFDQDLFNVALQVGFTQERTVPPDSNVAPLYDAAVEKYPEIMASVLASTNGVYDAALFNFDTTAGEDGAGQLAEDLNAAFAPAREAGLATVATSNFIINDLVVSVLRDSQVSSLALTLTAALLLLVINFWFESRRPMLGVITTIPVAMVVVWVFGIMAALNIPFGPVTATISALGIGIGIPYMIHVTHRYLEERTENESENDAVEETLIHTGGALAGSAVTTIAGFGILMISTTIPFRQFGFVIAYTILLALIAAVCVLPSMLVLWDRWHRNRGEEPFDEAVFEKAIGADAAESGA
ncbi:MAG: MMPL family transporter [Acidimicrobiia bacterium]|nr:MMPL family transporter [Acidimicrobiia bacterium]